MRGPLYSLSPEQNPYINPEYLEPSCVFIAHCAREVAEPCTTTIYPKAEMQPFQVKVKVESAQFIDILNP